MAALKSLLENLNIRVILVVAPVTAFSLPGSWCLLLVTGHFGNCAVRLWTPFQALCAGSGPCGVEHAGPMDSSAGLLLTLQCLHSEKNGEIDQQREQYENLKWRLERKLEELDGELALQRQVGRSDRGPVSAAGWKPSC